MATGVVVAGVMASFYELIAAEPLRFRPFGKSFAAWLTSFLLLAMTGPFIILRGAVQAFRAERSAFGPDGPQPADRGRVERLFGADLAEPDPHGTGGFLLGGLHAHSCARRRHAGTARRGALLGSAGCAGHRQGDAGR
ncbi:DUF6949 family protein [Kaistia algarum]|uniref:DUF6949 family protein n=1 Tax=Kaistia algarum TaxID=2083279 RepID=UPI0038994A71